MKKFFIIIATALCVLVNTNAQAVKTYDTVAALVELPPVVAASDTTGGVTSTVIARGLSAVGDGNGGFFYWDRNDSSTDTNAFNVFKATGITTGRWLRLGFPVAPKSGANKMSGTATLASGTVTVANTAVKATSLIFLQGTSATNSLNVGTVTANTSFVINSSDTGSSETVNWLIVEPAP